MTCSDQACEALAVQVVATAKRNSISTVHHQVDDCEEDDDEEADWSVPCDDKLCH